MMPISNAKDRPLLSNTGTLPDVSGALMDYFQEMDFTQITKTTDNFQVVETPTTITTQGVIQPFNIQQLMVKPPGERGWKWFMLHTLTGFTLQIDDVVTYLEVQYRVMGKGDYSLYGYREYHLVQDYTGSGPV